MTPSPADDPRYSIWRDVLALLWTIVLATACLVAMYALLPLLVLAVAR